MKFLPILDEEGMLGSDWQYIASDSAVPSNVLPLLPAGCLAALGNPTTNGRRQTQPTATPRLLCDQFREQRAFVSQISGALVQDGLGRLDRS